MSTSVYVEKKLKITIGLGFLLPVDNCSFLPDGMVLPLTLIIKKLKTQTHVTLTF
jgi:hypothetical protein